MTLEYLLKATKDAVSYEIKIQKCYNGDVWILVDAPQHIREILSSAKDSSGMYGAPDTLGRPYIILARDIEQYLTSQGFRCEWIYRGKPIGLLSEKYGKL